MNHGDVESLLGAYAIDAVDPDEASAVEAHLAECPRCRVEVNQHREVAALLGSGRVEEVPAALWERLSAAISPETSGTRSPLPDRQSAGEDLATVSPIRARSSRRWLPFSAGLAGAAAIVAVVVLGLQVSHLNDEIHSVAAENGLSSAVAAALVAPHQEVTLSGISTADNARVVISSDRDAYWVSSDLPVLPADESYQVWSAVGSKVVSIEVLGADPTRFAAFRVAPSVQKIMVTIEPAGGSTVPTTPVLVQAPLQSD